MTDMDGQVYEHRRKVANHRTDMTAFDRERMVDIECEEETHNFPGMGNGEPRQKDADDETLKYIHKTIKGKMKVIENLAGRIARYKKRMQHSVEKIEQLDKEIKASDNQLNEQNTKVEDQYQQFQRIKHDMGPDGLNDMLECIQDEIERWAEAADCMKETVRNWRENTAVLKDTVKEGEELIRFRNKIIKSIEGHAHLLATLHEANKIMKTTKGRMKAFQMLISEQERNIRTVSNRWTDNMTTERIREMAKSSLIETEIQQTVETEFRIMFMVCNTKIEEIKETWSKFELRRKTRSPNLKKYEELRDKLKIELNQYNLFKDTASECDRNTERSVKDVRKIEKEIEDLYAHSDAQKKASKLERKIDKNMFKNDENIVRLEWDESRDSVKGATEKLDDLSISLDRKIEQLNSAIGCMEKEAAAALQKMQDLENFLNGIKEKNPRNWKEIIAIFCAGAILGGIVITGFVYTGGFSPAFVAKYGLNIINILTMITEALKAMSLIFKKYA